MATITEDTIQSVAKTLYVDLYEKEYGRSARGRYVLTREQLRRLLGLERLHESTIERLISEAQALGLVIINLDTHFMCIESNVLASWRRVPNSLIEALALKLHDNDDVFGIGSADEEDLEL